MQTHTRIRGCSRLLNMSRTVVPRQCGPCGPSREAFSRSFGKPRYVTWKEALASTVKTKLQRGCPSQVIRSRGNLLTVRASSETPSDSFDLSSLWVGSLGLLFSLADSAGADVATAPQAAQRYTGFLSPISDSLETVLKFFQDGLSYLHVPYSYGFSIILLTVAVKVATFPFTKKQVESTIAMQNLKPRIDNIKLRYGDDKDKVQRETAILYEEAGVDPTAGCFPTLATIPILWGLYRTLTNVANEGVLDSEGFLWIPSLAGPTTIAARQAGTGINWLYPFVDGQPPIGWDRAEAYLVLPILLVLVQYISTSIISPPVDPNDDSNKFTKYLVACLPLLIFWFSLNVPSGLSLYYFSNTVLTSGQQIWLRKLGGADVQLNELGPVTKLGMGRRTGEEVDELPTISAILGEDTSTSTPSTNTTTATAIDTDSQTDSETSQAASEQLPAETDGKEEAAENGSLAGAAEMENAGGALMVRTRSKRKRVAKVEEKLVAAAVSASTGTATENSQGPGGEKSDTAGSE